ncbi:MAG TPA: glycosyltransferase family 2 protein [Candidatus Eisenbacteria bacterium]|uniref:Glycosyltransferase family 2 protein n=1 Tax=Eiseniibacteriota bacterium TaxID=2212470 RepID=A0A7V2AUE9_UNCEI|nr:glycosyltransferase family 2 protein [Candidatus Eisenbacteria bacterium]
MDIVFKLLFFTISGIIVYSYVGYPLVLLVMGIFRKRKKEPPELRRPSVALIISAYNEERVIREKIENTLKLDYPKELLRIIVASDGSTDATNEIVREYETRGVQLRAFAKREGKSATLNRAVLGLDEEIIVLSDANSFYREDAVERLVKGFRDHRVGCVVGRLIYLDNLSYVGRGEGIYWRYESYLNKLESRLGSVLVATGTIFALRRELFRPVLQDVANDFQLPAEVAMQGYSIVYEPEAIAYEQSTYFCKEEFSRKRRIIVRGLTGYRHLRGGFGGSFRTFQFISRKMLRWWVGPMLPLLYLSNIALIGETPFLAIFLLQTAFYLFAAVGALLRRGVVRSKIFLVPFYFVIVNIAALAAIVTYFAGHRLSSWEKAETTRDVENGGLYQPHLRVIHGKKLSFEKADKELENLERIT